jgi:outer membrane protein assembly factor BamE (lipoprotein component of BamABCDE complex)
LKQWHIQEPFAGVALEMHQSLSCGNMKTRLPLLLAVAALLCGCEPTIANRGNILDPERLAEIKAGTSTREDVASKLGTPTQVSTFDDKTWYYVGRQTEQYSFLDPDVVKQQAVEVKFDDAGMVVAINQLDLSGAQDISPAPGATPTYGRSESMLRQLLGDVAHPTLPGRTKNPGGR